MSPSALWKTVVWSAAILCSLLIIPEVEAVDRESCLVCHKYRFIGRIDQNGVRHNYSVDKHIFAGSLHRNVGCIECHTYIRKLPHDPVKEKVNCATECHLKLPFSRQNFSHQKIVDLYKGSAHGPRPEDPPAMQLAKPDCKFCHLNPVYTALDAAQFDPDKALRRCLNCHQQKGVTQAYAHITHRLRSKTSRSHQEIVALCSKCHADKAMLKKIDAPKDTFNVVETYNRSIHGKSIMLGSQKTADCISCHASNRLHDIYKRENPDATINKNNLAQTCRQCHKQTNSWFVQVAVHPQVEKEENPVVFFAGLLFRFMLYGAVFSMVGLMLFETYGRRRSGVKFLLRKGTSWRGKPKEKSKKKK
jgi:hypothetical protein